MPPRIPYYISSRETPKLLKYRNQSFSGTHSEKFINNWYEIQREYSKTFLIYKT